MFSRSTILALLLAGSVGVMSAFVPCGRLVARTSVQEAESATGRRSSGVRMPAPLPIDSFIEEREGREGREGRGRDEVGEVVTRYSAGGQYAADFGVGSLSVGVAAWNYWRGSLIDNTVAAIAQQNPVVQHTLISA